MPHSSFHRPTTSAPPPYVLILHADLSSYLRLQQQQHMLWHYSPQSSHPQWEDAPITTLRHQVRDQHRGPNRLYPQPGSGGKLRHFQEPGPRNASLATFRHQSTFSNISQSRSYQNQGYMPNGATSGHPNAGQPAPGAVPLLPNQGRVIQSGPIRVLCIADVRGRMNFYEMEL